MISHHHNAKAHPEGRVGGPGLLYGGVGLALAAAMQITGLFKQGDSSLKEDLLSAMMNGVAPDVLATPVLLMVAAVFSFGIALAVLDSPGTWRRIVLGVTAMVVLLAMVPAFAVWQIYFSPFLPLIALFWSWFCTMMYVNHHLMPCEHAGAEPGNQSARHGARVDVTVSGSSKQAKRAEPDGLDGPEERKKRTEKERDPDVRYQPKDQNPEKQKQRNG